MSDNPSFRDQFPCMKGEPCKDRAEHRAYCGYTHKDIEEMDDTYDTCPRWKGSISDQNCTNCLHGCADVSDRKKKRFYCFVDCCCKNTDCKSAEHIPKPAVSRCKLWEAVQ